MAFADDYLQVDGAVTHTHGPQGEHAHTGTAFTTWLDPSLAIRQARSIRDALARRIPDHATAFGQRFAEVERDLTQLDEQLRAAVKLNPTRPLLASHPVYQYLAARYDLDLRSVLWEPDEMPGEAEWQRLRRMLADQPAGWMLWEAEPDPTIAQRLRSLGVESVVFATAANQPTEGDYLTLMHRNVTNLELVFGPQEE